MSIKQLVAALEPAQRENCARILGDIEGMARLFNAPEGLIFQLLDEAGQEVLDSIETRQQLGLFMLDKLEDLEPVYEVVGEAIREALREGSDGGSTAHLADFSVFSSLVRTGEVLQAAADA